LIKDATMAAEQVLLGYESEALKWWGGFVDALPFYVLLVDEDHRIVAWNRTMSQEYGGIEPRGAYCPEIVHGQSHPYAGCPLEVAVRSDGAVETELQDCITGRWVASAVYPTQLVSPEKRRIYLHFARDITSEKQSQLALAQSLEHHKALGLLLQRLSRCGSAVETLKCLIDTTLELSWMHGTCGAAAFLASGQQLDLVYSRDLGRPVEERCARIAFGHCLCGRVASERKAIVPGDEHESPLLVLDGTQHDHGHAVFPLQHEGVTLGVVNFYVQSEIRLESSQRGFLEAAVSVTTSALGQQLSRAAAHEAELKSAALEHKLLELVIQSQEDERKRVARELHDDLGQALSALLLDIRTMAQDDGRSATEICARMDQEVRGLVSRVSSLAWDLRPAVLDDLGLDSALSRHIHIVAERARLAIDYQFIDADELESRLPNCVEIVLYRATQEALNNIVKHAGASHVSVLVYRHAESVMLVVEDDGNGFDVAATDQPKEGLGLLGMRERASLLKGTLVVESTPGEGTTIKITLPIVPEGSPMGRLDSAENAVGGAV
jgi:signal transduction histidine kinase